MIVWTVCGGWIDHNHFPLVALLLDSCDSIRLHTLQHIHILNSPDVCGEENTASWIDKRIQICQ